MSQPSSTAITPLSLDPKRNGAFGDESTPSATPAAVVDPTSGQTINTATGQPVVDSAQQEATMAAQSEAQSAQLQVQSAEQQAQAATQQAQLEAQKKDLEIQQAQQAAETAKAQLAQTTQQLKTQERQLAEVSKQQQPVVPQLSPAVTNRVKKIVGSVKPMDNSALMSMKLATAGLRPRGYQGGHDAKTTSLLAGARKMHNAKPPRTATAEEMRPHQQYGGQDWSNYRPRDGADPRDLSGTWGVASGPGYMEQINAARDRVLAKGGDPSAFGVTPIAPTPSPTAQPAQRGAPASPAAGGAPASPAVGGAPGAQAPTQPVPGTPEYDAAMKLRMRGSEDYQAARRGEGYMGYRPDGTWGLVTSGMGGQPAPAPAPAPVAPTPAPVAPTPAAAPPQASAAGNDPTADPTLFPQAPAASPPTKPTPYDPAMDPAMAPYGGASSPAAPTRSVAAPATSSVNKPFDRSGSLERILKGVNIPAAGTTPTAPTFSPRPFGVDPFKPGPETLLPPDNPLGLPPAMLPGQSLEGEQWDPAMQQLLYQLLGQATSGGYQPLGSLGGSYKLASVPPKPVAPQPAGPKIKSFDHGDYRFSDPEATKFLANPATPNRERSWAYDRAAQDYFKHWGYGTHNQAADYFAAQYPGQEIGQQVAERVRQLSNDQTRQQYRGEKHQTPVDTPTRTLEGDGSLWGKGKSFAAAKLLPLMPLRTLGETALGGWRDWTGVANQEMQDQLIPQQSRYGSVANMTPEQRQQLLATGVDQVAARQRDIDAWNHRWMGDQKDMGAGLSNLYGAFFEAGAPTPASPDKPDPMMNPWANYWNNSDSAIGKGVLGATMLSPAPLIQAAFTSPTVLKHALGDGQQTIQLAARAGGDAIDAFNQFGQGNWREGSEETRNAATAAVLARLNGQLLKPGKELLTRLPFYGRLGTNAFQPDASRGQAIDSGVYEGGQPGTAGAASPGLWSDLTTGLGKYLNVFRQPDPEAKPNAAAPLLSAATALTGVGPSVLGGNKAEVAPVPEKIQAQIAPTAGESVGGMQAVGDAITNATGAEPGSSTWVQILTLLLPFLAPMLARLGIGGGQNDGSLAGSSTANSYYGPEMYGGAV